METHQQKLIQNDLSSSSVASNSHFSSTRYSLNAQEFRMNYLFKIIQFKKDIPIHSEFHYN